MAQRREAKGKVRVLGLSNWVNEMLYTEMGKYCGGSGEKKGGLFDG